MQESHKLIVMRHAKAGELPGGPDFERALRPRGKRDSAAAGRGLSGRGLRADLVLCSAARRTRQTWQYLSAALPPGSPPEFVADRRLYDADGDDVADILRAAGGGAATILYIGHNPAAACLVGLLTGTEPVFPTAAVAVIGFQASLAELPASAGELLAYWTPAGQNPAPQAG